MKRKRIGAELDEASSVAFYRAMSETLPKPMTTTCLFLCRVERCGRGASRAQRAEAPATSGMVRGWLAAIKQLGCFATRGHVAHGGMKDGSIWFTFCSLWFTLNYVWFTFGSLLVHCWFTLFTFRSLLIHFWLTFGSRLVPFGSLWFMGAHLRRRESQE